MKAIAAVSTQVNDIVATVVSQQHRRYSYQKVRDGRKQPIRAQWGSPGLAHDREKAGDEALMF